VQTEHRNAEGRTYWFNTNTKESVWEKPDGAHLCCCFAALGFISFDSAQDAFRGTPARGCFVASLNSQQLQRALSATDWKEYVSGGRKYYYNVRCACANDEPQALTAIADRDEGVKMDYA